MPDTVVQPPEISTYDRELIRRLMYFKFVTGYAAEHKTAPDSDGVAPSAVNEFHDYLDKQQFTYREDGETKLDEFNQIATKENYGPSVRTEIEHLQREMANEKVNAFQKHLPEIRHELAAELASRYRGDEGRIAAGLNDDIQVLTAEKILSDSRWYDRLLKLK